MSIEISKSDYPTEHQYRDAVAEYYNRGYVVFGVRGGVMCFETMREFKLWVTA